MDGRNKGHESYKLTMEIILNQVEWEKMIHIADPKITG